MLRAEEDIPGKRTTSAAKRVSKEDVLASARILFAKRGYQQTTTREIAAHAGLRSGSLYHHFRTKEEILHAILHPFVVSVLPIFERVAGAGGGVVATFENMIDQSLQFAVQYPHVAYILITERRYLSGQPDFMYIEDYWRKVRCLWHGLLDEGGRTGAFRTDLDEEIVVHTITALVGAMARDQIDKGWPIDSLIHTQKEILVRGLSPA